MKQNEFIDKHPIWFALILEVVIIFVYLLSGTVASLYKFSNNAINGLANCTLVIIAILLLTVFGWWHKIGIHPFLNKNDWLFYLLPFIPGIVNLIPGIQIINIRHLIIIFSIALAVGFVEEVFFRGLMLTAIKASNVWLAIMVTSLLFAVTHALTMMAGTNPIEALAQIVYAFAIGLLYAALVIRKGAIWPLIISHFFINFSNLLQIRKGLFAPTTQVAILFVITIIFMAYGIWIMFQPLQKEIYKLQPGA